MQVRRERSDQAGGPFRPVRLWNRNVVLILVFLMMHFLSELA